MKNLMELAEMCMCELELIGIEYGKIKNWEVNTRAKSRWGLCTHHPDGTHSISISSRLLEDGIADNGAKNTIIHELLHTVKGTKGHGAEWKRLAEIVNNAYGYNIKRCSSSAEKGVEPITDKMPQIVKHRFVCKDCGKVYDRMRESNFTKNWENYRCGHCNGKFKKVF